MPLALLKREPLPKEKPLATNRDLVNSRNRWRTVAIKQDGTMANVQRWRRGAEERMRKAGQ